MNPLYPSARHRLGIALCIMLFGILTVMLGTRLYVSHLLNAIQYVDPNTTPTLSQEALDAQLPTDIPPLTLETFAPLEPEETAFQESDTQIGGETLLNILLIGQDRREGETRARSDTMILCTFNTTAKTITLTSFLRDLYVRIPGYKNNRLNAAYAAGGMPLLNQTLEENFGVKIDGNVEVDFSRFAEIIDLLGGVEIQLRQDEAELLGDGLAEGIQLLSGSQALAYARIRSLDRDGDFSRTERQRKVLTALVEAYRSAGLTTILTMADEILPLLTTDLTKEELLSCAARLLPMLSGAQIRSQHIPADGAYSAKMISGMSVLVPDLEKARALLRDTLMDSPNPSPLS